VLGVRASLGVGLAQRIFNDGEAVLESVDFVHGRKEIVFEITMSPRAVIGSMKYEISSKHKFLGESESKNSVSVFESFFRYLVFTR
jgi:hypothetical protein